MNRSQNDIKTLNKVKQIVKNKLPEFASRYFSHNMELKAPDTLLGYAIDLSSFFEYIRSMYLHNDKMVITDLEKITPLPLLFLRSQVCNAPLKSQIHSR